jgi:hypothetical protein
VLMSQQLQGQRAGVADPGCLGTPSARRTHPGPSSHCSSRRWRPPPREASTPPNLVWTEASRKRVSLRSSPFFERNLEHAVADHQSTRGSRPGPWPRFATCLTDAYSPPLHPRPAVRLHPSSPRAARYDSGDLRYLHQSTIEAHHLSD